MNSRFSIGEKGRLAGSSPPALGSRRQARRRQALCVRWAGMSWRVRARRRCWAEQAETRAGLHAGAWASDDGLYVRNGLRKLAPLASGPGATWASLLDLGLDASSAVLDAGLDGCMLGCDNCWAFVLAGLEKWAYLAAPIQLSPPFCTLKEREER
ncbi:unnamed protein product [Prunus armeniaca]